MLPIVTAGVLGPLVVFAGVLMRTTTHEEVHKYDIDVPGGDNTSVQTFKLGANREVNIKAPPRARIHLKPKKPHPQQPPKAHHRLQQTAVDSVNSTRRYYSYDLTKYNQDRNYSDLNQYA